MYIPFVVVAGTVFDNTNNKNINKANKTRNRFWEYSLGRIYIKNKF